MFHEPTEHLATLSDVAVAALVDIVDANVAIIISLGEMVEEVKQNQDPQLLIHLVMALGMLGQWFGAIETTTFRHFDIPDCPAMETGDDESCLDAMRIRTKIDVWKAQLDSATERLRLSIPNPNNN